MNERRSDSFSVKKGCVAGARASWIFSRKAREDIFSKIKGVGGGRRNMPEPCAHSPNCGPYAPFHAIFLAFAYQKLSSKASVTLRPSEGQIPGPG